MLFCMNNGKIAYLIQSKRQFFMSAGIAQLVEQLTCNQ